jgi:hypothetical protein
VLGRAFGVVRSMSAGPQRRTEVISARFIPVVRGRFKRWKGVMSFENG